MDHRERALYPDWGVQCDDRRMVMRIFNEQANGLVEHPAEFVVCSDCNGRGQYVNPSIDSQGLTQEDFDEDPHFREEYMAGRYDIVCRTCDGNRVILSPSDEQGKADLAAVLQSECETQACYEAERRMGA